MVSTSFTRPQLATLVERFEAPRRHIQVVSGARQVGKTTLARQALERIDVPHRFASADQPSLRGIDWIEQQWTAARLLTGEGSGAVLGLFSDPPGRIPTATTVTVTFS